MKTATITLVATMLLPVAAHAEICFPDSTCGGGEFVCKSTAVEALDAKDARYDEAVEYCNSVIDDLNILRDRHNQARAALAELELVEEDLRREKQKRQMNIRTIQDLQEDLQRYRLCAQISDTMAAMQACVGG